MSVSTSIRALLSMQGIKQGNLLDLFHLASKQSLSNKFSGGRWSADDLVKIADYTGCKLAFLLPDGERLVIGDTSCSVLAEVESDQSPARGGMPGSGEPEVD